MEFNKKVIDIACDYSLLLTANGYIYIHGYDENKESIYYLFHLMVQYITMTKIENTYRSYI